MTWIEMVKERPICWLPSTLRQLGREVLELILCRLLSHPLRRGVSTPPASVPCKSASGNAFPGEKAPFEATRDTDQLPVSFNISSQWPDFCKGVLRKVRS
jgi:hypothetical protein